MTTRRGTLCAVALTLCVFADAAAVRTERQYLSGTDRDSTVPWEFFCTAGRNSGKWTTIPVPSCWDMQGFGTLTYSKDDTSRPVEQGKYRHTFAVPAAWADKRVFLVFEGSMTDTQATVNGQSAGPVHQGGFYRFKYDVTKLLKAGASDNLLEVTVSKLSANESVNRAERQADYWLFGGIFRPVYLEAVPQQFIDRVAIDAKADGSFAVDVYAHGTGHADRIDGELRDGDGKRVAKFTAPVAGGKPVKLKTQVDRVRTWTAETPALYTATFRLASGDDVVHETTERFGFRTVEVRKGDGLYVNGVRVLLKGVCRHAFWPDSGRTLSPALDRKDIALMKEMNANAVRMSHYPPDQSFLDLCDQLGLYVIDELAGWQKFYDTETATRLVEELVVRDVNHPSILLWDNGNEGGWNESVDGEFARWDPQRRAVLHPWALHDDVNTKHYPKFDLLTELLAGPDIVMPTEILHGLYDGGIGAGMRDYWDAIVGSKLGAGMFFWVWADEGAVRSDEGGRIDLAGNRAPDGIVGPYRQKEGSFYTVKHVWSPVVIADALPDGFDGKLKVANGYDFITLDGVTFRWELRRWPGAAGESAAHETIAKGTVNAPKLRPRDSATLALPLPSGWRKSDALFLAAVGPDGDEIRTWVWPLRDARAKPNVALRERDVAELRSGNVVLNVDLQSGAIESITRAGRAIPFTAGPRLALSPSRRKDAAKPRAQLASAKWSAGEDGWFRLEYAIDASGPREFLGVTFDLPEQSVKSARWLGHGPYRVWKNRTEGVTLGVWENNYNNTITGWTDWKFPEFKGYVADLHWAQLLTDDGSITIATETPGLFLRLLTPELPPGDLPRTAMAPFPDGSVSLLHEIPAIGNKFHAAHEVGPQSQPHDGSVTRSAVVWFRFR